MMTMRTVRTLSKPPKIATETSRDRLPTGSRLPRLIQTLRTSKADLTSGDHRLTTLLLRLRKLWRNRNRIVGITGITGITGIIRNEHLSARRLRKLHRLHRLRRLRRPHGSSNTLG